MSSHRHPDTTVIGLTGPPLDPLRLNALTIRQRPLAFDPKSGVDANSFDSEGPTSLRRASLDKHWLFSGEFAVAKYEDRWYPTLYIMEFVAFSGDCGWRGSRGLYVCCLAKADDLGPSTKPLPTVLYLLPSQLEWMGNNDGADALVHDTTQCGQ